MFFMFFSGFFNVFFHGFLKDVDLFAVLSRLLSMGF